MLAAMSVEMRRSVKLLPAEETLVHLDVAVEKGVAIKMIRSIEPLSANLTEEFLAVRVGMHEQVTLEVVLLREPLTAHLARDGDLLRFAALGTHDEVTHNFKWLGLKRLPLNEG